MFVEPIHALLERFRKLFDTAISDDAQWYSMTYSEGGANAIRVNKSPRSDASWSRPQRNGRDSDACLHL